MLSSGVLYYLSVPATAVSGDIFSDKRTYMTKHVEQVNFWQ